MGISPLKLLTTAASGFFEAALDEVLPHESATLWRDAVEAGWRPDEPGMYCPRCGANTRPTAVVDEIRLQLNAQTGATLAIDLVTQTVTDVNGATHRFEIHPVRRQCLLEGLDDVDRTRQYQGAIEAFEAEYKGVRRWLY